MKYKIAVIITDPDTESEFQFKLNCFFCYDEEQYGNGH